MTESEWLSCTDPDRMLSSLASQGEPDERRLRVVACACVRQAWHLLTRPAQVAIETAEAYAEGLSAEEELARAWGRVGLYPYSGHPAPFATLAACHACAEVRDGIIGCLWKVHAALARTPRREEVRRTQAGVIRDVFGPSPFRTVAFDPRWRSRDVLTITHSIYRDRAYRELPGLADALEEAGCDCGELLNHCRGGGRHYLGCWGHDLVTGRG